MAEEHSNHLSADEFKAMYNNVMKKGKHEWLQINYKNPFNKRFLHRFTTVLNPTEESSDSE